MANVQDFACDICGQRVSEASPPILVYIVTGQMPNTGPPVDLMTTPAPALVRELMAQPIARREYCLPCFGQAIGQPLDLPAPPPAPGG